MVSSGHILCNNNAKHQTSELPNDEVEAFFLRQFNLLQQFYEPTENVNAAYSIRPFSFSSDDYWTWSPFDKDGDIVCSNDLRTAKFHPNYSTGTSGIRGTRALVHGKYFWEVETVIRNLGTSTMFGVATKDVPLSLNTYGNLLGKDNQSWGLSSNGQIWHNGKAREYCKPFDISQSTKIGILFDGDAGTLTFFKNGKNLGVAFENVKTCNQALYPMVCTTIAKTEMKLTACKKQNSSLQECCRDVVINQLNDVSSLPELHLPQILQRFLQGEVELKLSSGQSSESMEF